MTDLGTRRWWALGAIVLSVLTVGFDVTILNVALPTLAADIHATNSQLQWIVDAYILIFAGLLLPAGALGDRYGRRLLILIGLALFGAASAVATLSTDPAQLIAARAAMGVGAAILTPITLAVVPVLFPLPAERTKAVAAVTAAVGVGLPLGPLVGGYLLEHFWWGSIFLVNIPVAALALVAVAVLIPESKDPAARPIDLPGAALSTVGLVTVVYGIIEGPSRGWTGATVLASLGGGLIVLACFVAWQTRARHPMIDLDLFRDRRFLWGSICSTLASFALFGLLFVLPQYLQAVRGNDAFGTGLRLLPMMAGLIIAARVSATVVGVLGNRVPVAAGLAVMAAGLGWGASTDIDTGFGEVAGWLTVIGFGAGLVLTAAMDAVLGSLPPHRAGSGSGLNQTLRQVGGALGVAILGSVLADQYAGHIPDGVPPAARASVGAAVSAAARLGDPTVLAAGRLAYLDAMSVVLAVCAVVALLGAVTIALLLPGQAPTPPAEEESPHEVARIA